MTREGNSPAQNIEFTSQSIAKVYLVNIMHGSSYLHAAHPPADHQMIFRVWTVLCMR